MNNEGNKQSMSILGESVLPGRGIQLRFILLVLILADKLEDLPPVEASSVQEWQQDISTVRAYIGRSTGRSTPQWTDLMVKNGNFRFLLLQLILAVASSGKEW